MSRSILLFSLCVVASESYAQDLWFPFEEGTPITCDFCGYQGRYGGCHGGIDYRARESRNVRAAESGEVVLVVRGLGNTRNKPFDPDTAYGNHVRVRNRNGRMTIYAHLAGIQVEEGDEVTPATLLGTTDNSGWSTAPHLHFEVRDPSGRRVDPYDDPTDQRRCLAEGIPQTCGKNPLWATCPPQPWSVGSVDADSDGWTVAEGDCLDSGKTPKGVPANEIHPEAQEVCNYTDDDCDNVTDEGYEGVLAPCDNGEFGECFREGVYVCTEEQDDIRCSAGAGIPTVELCDGLDNDCDSEVDGGSACCGDGVCDGVEWDWSWLNPEDNCLCPEDCSGGFCGDGVCDLCDDVDCGCPECVDASECQ